MSHCKILIVEDDPAILAAMTLFLEDRGYAVFTAPDVRQGLCQVFELHPWVVVLDHELPDGTGQDIATAVRHADIGTPAPTLISCSATLRDASLLADFDHVIRKPFALAEFSTVIAHGCAEYSRRAGVS